MDEQIGDTAGDNAPAPLSRLENLMTGFDKWEMEFKKLKAAKEKAEKIAQELSKKLEEQLSKQWEMKIKCKDHTHALEVLELTLQKSIPLEDWTTPPPKLRTALEVAQEAIKAERTQKKNRPRAITF
ncbi:hypothetical protein F5B18DRAFT_646738 [Nemania serpens]|nr:hypothetical protein F5B18DRAFT_646738 [Nemania serpens]